MNNNDLLIPFTDEMLLAIPEIDAQHRHFVGLLNQLYHAVTIASPASEVEEIIQSLVGYAVFHFTTEEALMTKFSFPQIAEHKQIHLELKATLLSKIDAYHEKGADELMGILDFLEDWLVRHLELEDSKYAAYYKKMGYI